MYQAEKWTPSTQQDNKLLANERVSFWRRPARKLRKEQFRNYIFRATMDVGKNVLEVTEEKRLRCFGHVKGMPVNGLSWKILEWEPKGGQTGRNTKIDGWKE